MSKKFFAILVLLLTISIPSLSFSEEIKIAFVAPKGSVWSNIIESWDQELRTRTGGKLGFRIYAGGVSGDEIDIVRKMKIGQIQAAGLTGLGLGVINPEIRVLELPMFVQNYKEADAVISKLGPILEKGFQNKGFEVLGWSETGFVNLFTNKPISKCDDLKGMKMWAWEGDPLVKSMYENFEIVPIPLALPDVLTSLSTNLIDGVYGPPLAVIALQWNTKTKYMADIKLSNSTGGFIITKNTFKSLSPEFQKILKETGKKYGAMLKEKIRTDNERAYEALDKMGIKTTKISDSEVQKITTISHKVWNDLVGKLYSSDLLNEAKQSLIEVKKQ